MANPGAFMSLLLQDAPYPPLYKPFKFLSGRVALYLKNTRITSNAITLSWALLLSLCGYALALNARFAAFVLVLFAILLDCLDGDLARARNRSTQSGTMLEQIAHWVGNMSVAAGAGVYLNLMYPGRYAVVLSAVFCIVQAVYIAVVRQLGSGIDSGIDAHRAKRLLITVTRINYILSPIELPVITFFLIFGLQLTTVTLIVALLLLASVLIFVPHFLIILSQDQKRWVFDSSEEFPDLSVREAEKVLASSFNSIAWYAPSSSKLPLHVLSIGAIHPMYYRAKEFEAIWQGLIQVLPKIFRTNGRVVVLPCSGIGAMEAVVSNIVNPADRVLVLTDGPNSRQWKYITESYGAQVIELEVPFGLPLEMEALENVLTSHPPLKAVFATLSDSAHGGIQDIASIGERVRNSGALFVVDVILGLVADDFHMDEWSVDVAVGASEGGLMAPPGLGLVALGEQMVNNILSQVVLSTNRRFYWNFGPHLECSNRPRFTVPTQIVGALYLSARMILGAGLERIMKHREEVARGFRRGCIEVLGLSLLATNPSTACTTVLLPEEVKAGELQLLLQEKYSIFLETSKTPTGEETITIGHSGWIFRDDIYNVIQALALSLYTIRTSKESHPVEPLQ